MIPVALVLICLAAALGTVGMARSVPIPDFTVRRVGNASFHAAHGQSVGMVAAGNEIAGFGKTASEYASMGHWGEMGVAAAVGGYEGDTYRWTKGDPVREKIMKGYLKKYWPGARKRLLALGGSVYGATETGDLGTLPIFADPKFNDLSVKDVVVMPGILKEPITNKTFEWDPIVTKDSATYSVSEIPVVAEQKDQVEPQTRTVSLMFARITLSGLAERVSQGFGVDLVNDRVQRRIMAMMELEEATIIEGDGTGGSFKGMTASFTDNVVDLVTATITLDDLNDALLLAWENGGRPDFAIAPHSVVNKLAQLLEDKGIQRREIIPTTQAVGGWAGRAQEIIYNGIPIRGTRLMNTVEGTMNLVFYQNDMLRLPTLLDTSMMELGVTTDAKDLLLKKYSSFKDLAANNALGDGTGGQHHAVIKNIGVV